MSGFYVVVEVYQAVSLSSEPSFVLTAVSASKETSYSEFNAVSASIYLSMYLLSDAGCMACLQTQHAALDISYCTKPQPPPLSPTHRDRSINLINLLPINPITQVDPYT